MFKHFIFSDIKASTKLLAAGLVASGFRIGVKPVIATSGKKAGKPNGINILTADELAEEKANIPGCIGHFDLMASGSVFSKAITVAQKKQLFARFNARDDSTMYPRNNHGEQVRIIVMDNGFKEGVDLFDVKYVHIFEPQVTMADTKQVVGRGTRTCGQKGLTFDPERGWPLHVYVYDLDLGASKASFLDSDSAFDLYLKALNIDLRLFKLHAEIEELMMEGSVDYELNKAVHEFKGKADKELDYSWSRSVSSEIPFKLLEESERVDAAAAADAEDYIYEVAVMPAEMNAAELLNDLFSRDSEATQLPFDKGQGLYATDAYRVVLDYDMVAIQFKSLSSMQAIKRVVMQVGEALMIDDPMRYISPHIDFEDDGSSYANVDSFAKDSNSDADALEKSPLEIHSPLDSPPHSEEPSDNEEEHYKRRVPEGTLVPLEDLYPHLVATYPYVQSNGYKLINKAFGSNLKNANSTYKTKTFMLQGDGDILSLHVSDAGLDEAVELAHKVGKALKLGEDEYAIEDLGQDIEDLGQELVGGFKNQKEGAGGNLGSLVGGGKITFTPTQDFVSNYFTPQNPVKGMLLNHSVGTGKTCTAIATATGSFEPQGYTILWVTRTTLKNDIWKNMFDMVCHHGLMNRNSMPTMQSERMKLLSKSWSIRPISYKQFTNLVTKANSYYARLVRKNGSTDPLRKTLLIIDEAHKLFGGNDLSSIERPDTAKLHQALMSSYAISGDDSVRLLLMTATPITKDPLELVKLLNLCRLPDQQIPDTLAEFADTYLKEDGSFSIAGRARFLDDIAGHISYLNREKDARQFSQPVIHKVMVPFNNKKAIRSFDQQLVSRTYENESGKLKTEIATKALEIEEHFKEFDKFMVPMGNVCDDIVNGPLKKKCVTAVNKRRAELARSVKALAKTRKLGIKEIKAQVKKLTDSKKHKLRDIRAEAREQEDYYKEIYLKSVYSKLARCGKVDTENKSLTAELALKPDIQDVDAQVQHWKTVVPPEIMALAARIKAEKKILAKPRLKTLRLQLKDMKAWHRETKKKHLKALKKERTTLVKSHKKTIAKQKKVAVSAEKTYKKNLAAMRKLARKEGEVQEVINAELKELIQKHLADLPNDEAILEIKRLDEERVAKAEAKVVKAAEKALKAKAMAEKKELMALKKAEMALKKEQKAAEMAAKKLAKDEAKAIKDAEKAIKDAEKAAKAAEKEAKKTRKITPTGESTEIARCKKGTRKYKPMGPGCFTPEEIEAFKAAR